METRELVIESAKHGKHIVLYDAADAHLIEPYVWHLSRGHSTFYASRQTSRPNRTQISMHREIAGCVKGDGIIVDHKNKNGLDNRRSNIRPGTMSENMMNRGKTVQNSTGYKGVYNCGDSKLNPYTAKIQKDGIAYPLGHYHTRQEAARVYDRKAIELHGEFAVLNFPIEDYQ